MALMGTDLEVMLGKIDKPNPDFDFSKLRWNKVIILTDADVDGFHIRTLIISMFFRLMPSLITEGRLFIAETPLYELEYEGKTTFVYSDQERDEYLKGKVVDKVKIQRSKGLGQNTPEMMSETTLKPETRKLTKIDMIEAKKANQVLDILMGKNIKGRKKLIEQYGKDYYGKI